MNKLTNTPSNPATLGGSRVAIITAGIVAGVGVAAATAMLYRRRFSETGPAHVEYWLDRCGAAAQVLESRLR